MTIIANRHFSQLEDLFVRETVRNQGVGKALFAELAQIALDKVRCRKSSRVGADESLGLREDRLVCPNGKRIDIPL